MALLLRNQPGLLALVLALLCFSLSPSASSQSLESEAQILCAQITNEQRMLARASGYDVDSLCERATSTKKENIQGASQVGNLELQSRATVSSADGSLSSPEARLDMHADAAADAPSALDDQYRQYLEYLDEIEFMEMIEDDSAYSKSRLKPFGYDLFASVPATFDGPTNVPVPSGYVLGPGDSLDILFYGKTNRAFTVEINRDGMVDFPELGPVGLAGLSFAEAKDMLQSLIAAQMIGTEASIRMGTLRSMQIFVLGEAFKPGAYTVSSMATITNALLSSGGVTDIASLRNIQLKRSGKVVAELDLYELLMFGSIDNDMRLQSGDVIYIPTVGELVSIEGQVLRPAIYELKGETTAGQLVELAGGLAPKAFARSARLERVTDDGFMTVLDLDLSADAGRQTDLVAGDHLRIDSVTDYRKAIVSLQGYIHHPGDFAWRAGMRVSDLIQSIEQFPTDIDIDYALVVREVAGGSKILVKSLDLASVLEQTSGVADIELLSRDTLMFFSRYQSREDALAEIIEKLNQQSRAGSLAKVIRVDGAVRFPGEYPLVENMRMKDLVGAAGGLMDSAYELSAEIFRTDLSDPEKASNMAMPVNLANEFASELLLVELDRVVFRTIPEFYEKRTVTLAGEVVFPGAYNIQRGDTLGSVIERAGGFTDLADIRAAVFTRETLRLREQEQIEDLQTNLEGELAASQLAGANQGKAIDEKQKKIQQQVIDKLANSQAVGRLVIPLQDIIHGRSNDVLVEDGDRLAVPIYRQEISVIGEVQRPTSYFYEEEISIKAYLEKSGGLLDTADKDGVYLVKASGEVVPSNRRGFFSYASRSSRVEPGDTIVVPIDPDDPGLKGLPLVAEVSQILYQLALGAAALNSF